MKHLAILVAGVLATTGAIYVIAATISGGRGAATSPFVYLGPAIVVVAGLTAGALRRRAESRNRTAEPDSVEWLLASRARAASVTDGIIFSLALGVLLLIVPSIPGALGLFLAVIATVADFYIRNALLQRRARAQL